MSTFTADAAAALDGPDWLRDRRAAAVERFEASGVPSSEEEVWRYSRVDELDLDQFRLTTADDAATSAADERLAGHGLASAAARVVVRNGWVGAVDTGTGDGGSGVEVGLLAGGSNGRRGDDETFGAIAGDGLDAFADLNTAFHPGALRIRVPAGVTVADPVLVQHLITADGAAVFPRVVIEAGENSQVTVVEHYRSADVHALVAPVVEIDVARGARLSYVAVQELGPRVWQIANQVSRVGQEASFLAASAGLGGDYARLRSDCRLVGRGATGDLLAAYFGEGHQTLDYRTFQDHRAPDTTSNLLFKGVVGGHSRSVYTGLIRVRKNARGTNAFQTNRNIKLSDSAWAESVPNLEIENNDVHCSHASAVGPVDDDQRFYLESRGVPPEVAERLVVSGFFDEVIARIPVPELAGPLRAAINGKLDRREAGERS
ncbi:MAG: Fe-S cluster assembly protein SufD [Acidimicrobiales bacterium]